MEYTIKHYAVMEKLSVRLIWDNLPPDEKDIILFLVDEKIAAPRAYIEEGLYVLTEKGKCILEEHRRATALQSRQAEKESRDEAKQENNNDLRIRLR